MTKEKLVNLMSETMDGHKNQMLLLPFTEKTRKKRWEFSRTEEGRLANDGHEIIWTPPYVPELQPIELFWGVGKKLRWIL
mmetsp:Transcript_32288/g.74383  ORF Transcript_32288/g.74383 Transcript_32288/m.74383 type:complete len:80 (-) Transcript_32288:424-663(-)